MNQNIGFGDAVFTDLHNLQLEGARFESQALLVVLAVQHRFAVLQMKLHFGGDVLAGEMIESAIVVNNAVLKNFDQRRALVGVTAFQHFG